MASRGRERLGRVTESKVLNMPQRSPVYPNIAQSSQSFGTPYFWVLQRIAMDAVARVFRDRRCLCNAPSHSRQPNTCKYFQRSFCYVQSLHRSILTRKVSTVQGSNPPASFMFADGILRKQTVCPQSFRHNHLHALFLVL